MSSVLLVFQLGQPRIFMSMARDGLLPPFLAKVHPRFKTPYVGTIITGFFVATFAAFANIAEVVDLTNIGTLFAFVLVSAGVIVLRRLEPDRVRPFRAPWVPFTPIVSIVACLYLMLQLPRLTWIRFGIWLALGLVIYFFYGIGHSRLGSGWRGRAVGRGILGRACRAARRAASAERADHRVHRRSMGLKRRLLAEPGEHAVSRSWLLGPSSPPVIATPTGGVRFHHRAAGRWRAGDSSRAA